MKNFLRALRHTWPYRYRLAFSVVCALCAAVLWSLNFTAIYPVLTILGNDRNLQSWAEERIKETEKQIDQYVPALERCTAEQERLKAMPASEWRDKRERSLAGDMAKLESKLNSARTAQYRYQLLKSYILRFLPDDSFQALASLIGLLVLGVAIKGVFEFGQESLVGSVVNLSLYDLRNRFYRNVIHLDVNEFGHGKEGTHELMSRFTNDMELLGVGIKTLYGKVIAEPLKAICCIIWASWISWQLTFMFLILVPIAVFVVGKVGRLMKRATRRLLERMSSIYKILQETFLGIRIVKAFTMEPYERRRFKRATLDYYHKSQLVVNIDALAGPVIELLGVAAGAMALLAGAYLVLRDQTHLFGMRMTQQPLEAAELIQLYALLAAIADPVRKLSSVWTKLQSGAAAGDRIFDYMDRMPRVQVNSQGERLPRLRASVEFRDVCFSYIPGKDVLSGVNLTCEAGETIALVGKNGCGKTTLLGMLLRFYDPSHGSVLLDGVDIRRVNLRTLRQQIGLVSQDAILFDDTIHNNIAYGVRGATREDVERAAKQTYAHDFIMQRPDGYDTRIGESGGTLSGGQKQRIALARAVLRNPSLLILDEFTSQIDSEDEVLIHKALREFMKGRTTFVITHRHSTLEIADRIVVLDKGRVEAVGTHRELLATCSLYQRLHEAHSLRQCA
ncbi:MAG: ABC transporter ATP-binding protein [Planctomycetia bacterium]|nr:ABC transporter ATP-binding protein [Planctomycetia bacterium]